MNPLLMTLIYSLLCMSKSRAKPDPYHNNTFVFKICTDRSHTQSTTLSSTAPDRHMKTLSALFQELVSRSSDSKFFKTSEIGDEEELTAISGAFQCREEISAEQCRSCVTKLSEISRSLCGGAESARIQLRRCYVRYEPDDGGIFSGKKFSSSSSSSGEILHKNCGDSVAAGELGLGLGFEAMRESAFAAVEDEILGGGVFGRAVYESVAVAAQCEGGTEGCECGECVSEAARIAAEQCGSAFSGEVYLDKCFLTYSYFPQGVPTNLYPDEDEDEENEQGGNSSNGKMVAIIVGGAAALGLGIVFMLFIKSCAKKYDYD